MPLPKQETFECEGKTFTIHLVETDDRYEAAAYEGDRQVTCLHTVSHTTNFGFFRKFGESYIPQLIEDIKHDISMGWYLK